VTDPTGNAVTSQFDPDGNLISISDPEGALFRYRYDPCGWLTGCSDACGGSEEYQRDAAGRITTILSGSGSTVDFVYDPEGRIIQKKHNGSVFSAYGYDNDGNLISLDDRTGRTTCSRDACGQVSAITYPDGKTVSFTYDPEGRATSVRYPDGTDVVYAYDSRGRIVSARWGSGDVRFTYDRSGNITGMDRSNGIETSCRYMADNRPAEIRHARGSELLAHLQYTRDANRNVTEERAFLPFQPDPAPRVFSARCNRIGQIVSWDARAFTYNAGGCLTGDGTGQWEAAYDQENRLIRVVRDGRVQEYTFNGLGQRTGILSEAGNRTLHYDIFGRLLFETDPQGAVVSCYIYAGSHLIARQRPGAGPGFYHFDKTGNTIFITGAAGKVEAAYAYDTHGMASTSVMLNPDKNPFTFVGMYGVMDDGEGLYLMNRRHFDAVTGRFLQRDPVGIQGGLNLYAYAGNNPVTIIDPEGTDFGITIAVISMGALIIGVGAWASNTFSTPKNNTIIRALGAVSDKVGGKITGDQMNQTIGPNPGEHATQEILGAVVTVGDKAVGAHPVFGPGYKAIKAGVLIGTGKPGEGVITGITALPAPVGKTAGAIKNVVGAVNNCTPP
jgi:RHS repeat-associated protein